MTPPGLRVMYFDESARSWREVEGAHGFDPATGRAWAETDHFTKFAVFYIPDWDAFWSVPYCKPRSDEQPLNIDVALVIDSSGSMYWNDPDGLRKVGAKLLVDSLWEQDRAAVVDFDNYATVLQRLTTDKAAVKAAIDRIDDWGGTDIAQGVYTGLQELAVGDPERGRLIVLLTDGDGYYEDWLTGRAVELETAIYTIGLGDFIDAWLLQDIASRTGGKFYHVLTAADLPSTFERISDDTGLKDSDGDGLSDCAETGGMPDDYGHLWFSNPNAYDSDGDGLSDALEMGVPEPPLPEPLGSTAVESASTSVLSDREPQQVDLGLDEDPAAVQRYLEELQHQRGTAKPGEGAQLRVQPMSEPEEPVVYAVVSDPLNADGDGDGLPDDAELVHETMTLVADADWDGLNDYQEVVNGTDPFDFDTDGDGLDDGYEVNHSDDGFDPLVVDERMTAEEWMQAFELGALTGDTCGTILSGYTPCQTNIPFFLGQLAGGASSFIPVVGWIVGLVADVRDAFGAALKGDWAGAAFSVAGVLPYFGDAAKLVAKVVDFISLGVNAYMVLRAIYPWLIDLLGEGDSELAGFMMGGSGPPAVMGLGSKAKELLLAVVREAEPQAFTRLSHRFGNDQDLLARLALLGKLDEVAVVFDCLGDLIDEPEMAEFLRQALKSSNTKVLFNRGGEAVKLSLDGKVTINLKKATGQIKRDPEYVDAYIQRMKNHLRGAQAEHATLAKYPGDEEIIPLHHVTASGPDRVVRVGETVKVLEVKSSSSVTWNDVKDWFVVAQVGDQRVVQFNGPKLELFLKRHNSSIGNFGDSIQFDADNPIMDSTLFALLGQGSVPLAGFGDRNIQLLWSDR